MRATTSSSLGARCSNNARGAPVAAAARSPCQHSNSKAVATPGRLRTLLLSSRRGALQLRAMQAGGAGGWTPQGQPMQQPMMPPQQQQQQQQQPQQPQQQPQMMGGGQQQQVRQPMPLARSPTPYQQAGPVFLELTQVLNKQVITRTSGRCLGCISGAWLDPAAGTLVSFDLDERRQGGSGGGLGSLSTPPRAGNIPLSALRQIGDVVLVHDESGLYEQDLDGRLGFVNPVGLDVRTRAGEFLGKVRDLSFSPDTGAIRRITYDEFGLPFLPISFFDCYSVAMQDVISIGRGDLLVYDDAKYRERKESAGLFAAIPSLFKSLNGPGRSGMGAAQLALPAPGTSDMYRLGGPGSTTGSSSGGSSSSSRFLPTDYTYEQWQADLRRWEAETGMTYEQYLRAQSQQPSSAAAAAAGPRNALPPGRSAAAPGVGYAAPAAGGYGAPQQQQYAPPQQQPGGYMQQPQQQRMYQQQQPQQQQPPMGQQAAPAWQQTQQPQQQQQFAPRPAAQQYSAAGGFGPQQAGGFAAAAGGAGGYSAAAGGAAAAAGNTRFPQQQPQQQQSAAGFGGGAAQQPQQQRPPGGQQQAGQARVGTNPAQQPLRTPGAGVTQRSQQPAGGSTPPSAAGAAAAQQQQKWQQSPQQQQQQQEAAGAAADGRPVNEWLGETRPRIADALANGVLPSSEDAPANPTAGGGNGSAQPQMQQQEVA